MPRNYRNTNKYAGATTTDTLDIFSTSNKEKIQTIASTCPESINQTVVDNTVLLYMAHKGRYIFLVALINARDEVTLIETQSYHELSEVHRNAVEKTLFVTIEADINGKPVAAIEGEGFISFPAYATKEN